MSAKVPTINSRADMTLASLKRCRAPSADSSGVSPRNREHDGAALSASSDTVAISMCSSSLAQYEEADSTMTTTTTKTEGSTKTAASPFTTQAEQAVAASDLEDKCRQLARLISGSSHLVAFTGAGISTSVGLPDYRGEAGIRTKNFDKHQYSSKNKSKNKKKQKEMGSESNTGEESSGRVLIPDFQSLVPSATHMALFELYRLGYLKHVVTQNVDNLHLKSGLPASVLTEVHGNATQAKCETCEKIYTDNFPWTGLCDDEACISTKRPVEQRLRARTRHGNGRLRRNVISFDEPLGDIDHAIDECEAADVALVLGTSLRVEPFTEMAGTYAASLAIVNLLPTTPKLDRRAETTGVRISENCDIVMRKIMKYLVGESYDIPAWQGTHATSVFVPEHEESGLVNVLAGRLLSS